jgi:hypothetical protein
MQDRGYGLPRIHLLGTWVNKGKTQSWGSYQPQLLDCLLPYGLPPAGPGVSGTQQGGVSSGLPGSVSTSLVASPPLCLQAATSLPWVANPKPGSFVPPEPPVLHARFLCGGAANAGKALTTTKVAMSTASPTIKMMRLIEATSFIEGETRQPRQLANATTLASIGYQAHHANE